MAPSRFGTALAIASVLWTSYWSWRLFGDRSLPIPLMTFSWFPVVASVAGAMVRKGRVAIVLRSVAVAVLYVWGVLLFTWMFLFGGALMLGAAVLAIADADDTRSSVPPTPTTL